MIDYSEKTADLQERITKLGHYLRQKKWLKANILCLEIIKDLIELSVWLAMKG